MGPVRLHRLFGGRRDHCPVAAAHPHSGGRALLPRVAVYPHADPVHGRRGPLQLYGQRLCGDQKERGVLLDLSGGGDGQRPAEPVAHPLAGDTRGRRHLFQLSGGVFDPAGQRPPAAPLPPLREKAGPGRGRADGPDRVAPAGAPRRAAGAGGQACFSCRYWALRLCCPPPR